VRGAQVVEACPKVKGAWAGLEGRGGAAFYAVPGRDISADIVKRLDALGKK